MYWFRSLPRKLQPRERTRLPSCRLPSSRAEHFRRKPISNDENADDKAVAREGNGALESPSECLELFVVAVGINRDLRDEPLIVVFPVIAYLLFVSFVALHHPFRRESFKWSACTSLVIRKEPLAARRNGTAGKAIFSEDSRRADMKIEYL